MPASAGRRIIESPARRARAPPHAPRDTLMHAHAPCAAASRTLAQRSRRTARARAEEWNAPPRKQPKRREKRARDVMSECAFAIMKRSPKRAQTDARAPHARKLRSPAPHRDRRAARCKAHIRRIHRPHPPPPPTPTPTPTPTPAPHLTTRPLWKRGPTPRSGGGGICVCFSTVSTSQTGITTSTRHEKNPGA